MFQAIIEIGRGAQHLRNLLDHVFDDGPQQLLLGREDVLQCAQGDLRLIGHRTHGRTGDAVANQHVTRGGNDLPAPYG